MSSQILKLYYERFFPTEKLFKWLKINQYRELSFTIEKGIFLRYQVCKNHYEFSQKIKDLSLEKIDVGAIYDVKPEMNKIKQVVEKELVFDIDLTDYDRKCCNDKNICDRCIPLIKVAIELLEYILKEELGFKQICFVFSGRRGLHCWITDPWSLKFTEDIRSNIVSYIEKVSTHSMYSDKYTEILRKYIGYLVDQGFIDKKELGSQKILQDKKFIKLLYDKMFLKIDSEVTKSMIHLLKMPFCVHPSSKMLSLPIDPKNLNNFKKDCMITLDEVISDPNILKNAFSLLDRWISSSKRF